ncbi:hypothetical protein D9619_006650 [Psilocybe cf. subviscida]|uniref:Uncharacterized protein n=1 Tax=Psilocybe cf. subviscida TaxID=2480587 RepID=A0A8H5EY94_9AGAR|nr:hypothetical protein D9619_006650 [Psilocybe cf. subviscida]
MSSQPQHTQPRRDRKLASPPSSINRLSTPHSFATANTQHTEKPPSHDRLYFPRMDSDASRTSDFGHLASHHSSPLVQIIPPFVASPTRQGVKSPSVYFPSSNGIDIHKQLPPVVESIRAGWQQTCQGSAVVSGLLAAVAAQLLQYFRDDNTYNRRHSSDRAKTAILALCYATIFLNIASTIFAFVIIDKMGALASAAAGRSNRPEISSFDGAETKLLEHFGAGSTWKYIMAEWLFTFYAGVLCLVALLLTFVWLQEALVIGISMTILIALTVVPPMVSLVFGSRNR